MLDLTAGKPTNATCNHSKTTDKNKLKNTNKHKCDIHQGDAPLLFSKGLDPLSQVIHKTCSRYWLPSKATISSHLYTDFIKLYAKSIRDIDSLIHTTRISSSDIRMSFSQDRGSQPTRTLHKANGNIKEATRN